MERNKKMNTQLHVLAKALRQAKMSEELAKEHRLQIEAEIIEAYKFLSPESGEGTIKDEYFNIVYKVTRKVDTEALQMAWDALGPNAHKAIKWSADLDLKNFRALKELVPQTYNELAVFVTTKPAKPSVSLKE
jgi:hypothetical protein